MLKKQLQCILSTLLFSFLWFLYVVSEQHWEDVVKKFRRSFFFEKVIKCYARSVFWRLFLCCYCNQRFLWIYLFYFVGKYVLLYIYCPGYDNKNNLLNRVRWVVSNYYECITFSLQLYIFMEIVFWIIVYDYFIVLFVIEIIWNVIYISSAKKSYRIDLPQIP